MDTVKEGIRRNLADLIANSDKKKVDLAKACGVGRSAVTNWVNGESGIDIERIPAICTFFGVSIDEFFGRARDMEPIPDGQRQMLPLSNAEEELITCFRSLEQWEQQMVLSQVNMMHLHAHENK